MQSRKFIRKHSSFRLAFSYYCVSIMTWNVIEVPSTFMASVQTVVNGFISTIEAWFPDLLLISLLVGLTMFAINYISRKVSKSWRGRA